MSHGKFETLADHSFWRNVFSTFKYIVLNGYRKNERNLGCIVGIITYLWKNTGISSVGQADLETEARLGRVSIVYLST